MKVSDAIAEFLAQHVRHVFCISGGASLHLIHSIAAREDIAYICPQNEQAAAFSADAYARVNGMGAAIATSGPGATNLITGIAASFYDSVPVLYITGNQTRERMKPYGRQYGFQATPIVPMVRDITKYAATIMEPAKAVDSMRECVQEMMRGRRGPALIDIPDDVQRAQC